MYTTRTLTRTPFIRAVLRLLLGCCPGCYDANTRYWGKDRQANAWLVTSAPFKDYLKRKFSNLPELKSKSSLGSFWIICELILHI